LKKFLKLQGPLAGIDSTFPRYKKEADLFSQKIVYIMMGKKVYPSN